jgi:hypothetical protein
MKTPDRGAKDFFGRGVRLRTTAHIGAGLAAGSCSSTASASEAELVELFPLL